MAKRPEPSASGKPTIGAEARKPRSLALQTKSNFDGLNKLLSSAEKDGEDAKNAKKKAFSGDFGKNAHKGAVELFRKLCKVGKKNTGRLEEFLVHFDHYRKIGGLDELAGLQGNLDVIQPPAQAAKPSDDGERDVRPQHLIDREKERAEGSSAVTDAAVH